VNYWKLALAIAGGLLIADAARLLLTFLASNATGGVLLAVVLFALLLAGAIWLRNYGTEAKESPGGDQ
jgi:hypothetical protein